MNLCARRPRASTVSYLRRVHAYCASIRSTCSRFPSSTHVHPSLISKHTIRTFTSRAPLPSAITTNPRQVYLLNELKLISTGKAWKQYVATYGKEIEAQGCMKVMTLLVKLIEGDEPFRHEMQQENNIHMVLDPILQHTLMLSSTWDARIISNLFVSMYRLHEANITSNSMTELINTLSERALPMISTMDASELSNILHSCAHLHRRNDPVIPLIINEVITRLQTTPTQFQLHHLTTLLLATATLQYPAPELFDTMAPVLLSRLHQKRSDFRPQHLVPIFKSYALASHSSPSLFESLLSEVMKQLSDPVLAVRFFPREVSDLLWSAVTLNLISLPLFHSVSTVLISMFSTPNQSTKFTTADLATLVWCYASAKRGDCNVVIDSLFKEMMKRMKAKHAFTSEELEKITYACKELKRTDKELVTWIEKTTAIVQANSSIPRGIRTPTSPSSVKSPTRATRPVAISPPPFPSLSSVTPTTLLSLSNDQLISYIWSLSKSSQSIDARTCEIVCHHLCTSGSIRWHTFSIHHLSHLLHSLVTLRYRHVETLFRIGDTMIPFLSSCTTHMLSDILYAFAIFKWDEQPFMDTLLSHITKNINEQGIEAFSWDDISNIAWSLMVLEYETKPNGITLLHTLLQDMLHHAKNNNISNVSLRHWHHVLFALQQLSHSSTIKSSPDFATWFPQWNTLIQSPSYKSFANKCATASLSGAKMEARHPIKSSTALYTYLSQHYPHITYTRQYIDTTNGYVLPVVWTNKHGRKACAEVIKREDMTTSKPLYLLAHSSLKIRALRLAGYMVHLYVMNAENEIEPLEASYYANLESSFYTSHPHVV